MNYIILDLEWNEPVSRSKRAHYPITLSGEIIQIGAVKTDENLNEIDSISIIIRPRQYQKITKRIYQLTEISNRDIETGIFLDEAIKIFRDWSGDDCIWLTWSTSDESVMRNNLKFYNMDESWIPDCYDVQLMFDDMEMGEGRAYPLNYAIYHFNIKPLGAHNAFNDAMNTLQVIKKMDSKEWISEEMEYRQNLKLNNKIQVSKVAGIA